MMVKVPCSNMLVLLSHRDLKSLWDKSTTIFQHGTWTMMVKVPCSNMVVLLSRTWSPYGIKAPPYFNMGLEPWWLKSHVQIWWCFYPIGTWNPMDKSTTIFQHGTWTMMVKVPCSNMVVLLADSKYGIKAPPYGSTMGLEMMVKASNMVVQVRMLKYGDKSFYHHISTWDLNHDG